MLQEAGQRAGAEDDGALLVAGADAVEQGLGQRGDVFAALAQRGNGEADGGEAEGEVGQQQALAGHLAQRGLRGGQTTARPGGRSWRALSTPSSRPWPGGASRSTRSR